MIGIVPAGGEATRMGGIPKMLLPIPGGTLIDMLTYRMQKAKPRIIIIHAGSHNHTLLETVTSTNQLVIYGHPPTMSSAAWQVFSLISLQKTSIQPILFGMPDTYFDDGQAFVKLATALDDGADVAVGLFLTRLKQRSKLGMCDFDPKTQQITRVIDKPENTDLAFAWGVLAWKPSFWSCIQWDDPHVGYGLPRAIEAGLDVRAVKMDGQYFDCGTPDEYFECIEHLRNREKEAKS